LNFVIVIYSLEFGAYFLIGACFSLVLVIFTVAWKLDINAGIFQETPDLT